MAEHNILNRLVDTFEDFPASGSIGTLVAWGEGAPTGTPTTSVYIRTDGGVDTVIYVDEAGTWAALTS